MLISMGQRLQDIQQSLGVRDARLEARMQGLERGMEALGKGMETVLALLLPQGDALRSTPGNVDDVAVPGPGPNPGANRPPWVHPMNSFYHQDSGGPSHRSPSSPKVGARLPRRSVDGGEREVGDQQAVSGSSGAAAQEETRSVSRMQVLS